MDFQQIRDFVNPAVAQATGLQEVENLSMPVPVAYVPVQLVIDGALSLTSENPVQNKVIAVAIQNLDGRITAIEGQFSEGVTEAVNNWLAAHPEATTTVQDGSLTEEKLTDATQMRVLNNYVTPEMFGAKGDGSTDDTQAIKDMFASDNTVFVFSNKTYRVSDSIDVDKRCDIYFNFTYITLTNSGATVPTPMCEYVIGFKAQSINTYGILTVGPNKSANIGIWLSGCGRSNFDTFFVSNARMWGICVDPASLGNNSMIFNRINVSSCGFKVHAKAVRLEKYKLAITNMTSTTAFWGELKSTLFGNEYAQSYFVIDDSGYTAPLSLPWRLVFANDRGGSTSPFVLDENDKTKATFTFNTSGAYVPESYAPDAENARDVFIPIGGGLNFQSASSEGVISINHLTTQSNPISFRFMMGYAGHIGTYCTEYDTMVMISNALALNINYLYYEAVGNGYSYRFNNAYDQIILFTSNMSSKVFVDNPLNSFKQGNNIVNQFSFGLQTQAYSGTLYDSSLINSKLRGASIAIDNNTLSTDVSEVTSRNITVDANGFSSGRHTFTINLNDVNAYYTNNFEPLRFYVRRRQTGTNFDSFSLKLSTALLNAGYTLNGSIDNVLTVHPSEYNNYVKITVILFKYTKTFVVTAEALPVVDNTAVG